jgi:uncharacterized protein YjbI with pentapeptide repeats
MSGSEDEQEEEEVTQCSYIFEPSEEKRPTIQTALGNKWHCPHPAVEQIDGEQRCIFHTPIGAKDSREVQERFLECVRMEGSGPKRFIGAEFQSLSLINYTLGSQDHNPLDLRNTTFHGDVSLDGSSVLQPIYLTDAVFESQISAIGTRFHSPFYAQNVEFGGQSTFRKATFHNVANLRRSNFTRRTEFFECTFGDEISFYGCEFDVDPQEPTGVLAKANHKLPLIQFSNSTFSQGANFNSTTYHDIPFFNHVTSRGTVHLNNIEVHEKHHTYEHVVPEEEKSGHQIVTIGGDFSGLRLSFDVVPEAPCIVSLSGIDIESGQLSHPEDQFIYFDLEYATLGNVNFKNMTSRKAWEYLIFNQTNFKGVDFTNYHSALAEIGFDICAVRETQEYNIIESLGLREKETTFVKAGIGADEVRDYRSSSEFHIHELDSRRSRLWDERRVGPYFAHLVYSLTSRYGEKPIRVVSVFVPVLLVSYWATRSQVMNGEISAFLGLLLILLPPIFSALLVLSSSRYIGN